MKPFQVMCVFIGSQPEYGPEDEPMMISVGSEYTVISKWNPVCGPHYELSHQLNVMYPVEFFATLPEATADEMQQQEFEAILM
jgi:hypothetical protein